MEDPRLLRKTLCDGSSRRDTTQPRKRHCEVCLGQTLLWRVCTGIYFSCASLQDRRNVLDSANLSG